MADTDKEINPKPQKKRSVLYIFISLFSLLAIPTLTILMILFFLITSSSFYTEIAKNSQFISTFVKAYKLQSNARVEKKIEKELKLSESKQKFEESKKQYRNAKKAYYQINKTDEYKALKKREDKVDDMEWENHKNEFASEDKFEEYQEEEEKRIEKELDNIKEYRDKNEDAIEQLEDVYKSSKETYEDLMEDLDDKYEDAQIPRL